MIPANIRSQLADLQAAFVAASPIDKAPPLVFADVDAKAVGVVVTLDMAGAEIGEALDGFSPGGSAPAATTALLTAASQANDALDVFEARSLIGRFLSNIELIEGAGRATPRRLSIVPQSVLSGVLNFKDAKASGLLAAVLA